MRKVSLASCVALVMAALVLVPGTAVGSSFSVDGAVAVSAAVGLAEAHLGGLLQMMEVLASTADLQVGVWGGMRDLLAQFEELPISFNAWFLLPDGGYYKVATGLTGGNLSDRAYFPRVMAGETTIGDLVVSKSTGRKSMIMTVPIERNGAVIGALGVTVYLDDLSRQLVDTLALPEGVVFYAETADGLIALHSDPAVLLEDVSAAGVDGILTVRATSSLLGWTFVVGSTP